jgi:transcriptional regulator with XRE-family HTH domain
MLTADFMRTVSSFGRAIRVAREDRKMTQKELAKSVGVNSTTIAEWEAGRHVPVRENLDRLLSALPILRHARLPESRDIPVPQAQRQSERIAELEAELARLQDKNFHLEAELRGRDRC